MSGKIVLAFRPPKKIENKEEITEKKTETKRYESKKKEHKKIEIDEELKQPQRKQENVFELLGEVTE